MKFKIMPDKDLSRAVYNMASGGNREFLEHVIGRFTSMSKDMALGVCTDVVDGGDKAFDRGFVKGFNEAAELLVRSFQMGDTLFHNRPVAEKLVTKF
jgi:hypothetical protein